MKSDVKMSDIAKALGVSTVTVSKALGDKDGVGENLRRKIKEKAIDMGYRISSVSKAMRTGRQGNIGILIGERYLDDRSYYWSLYQNLLVELMKNGYFGILEIVSSADEKRLITPKIIEESKVDAIIMIGQLRKRYLNKVYEETKAKVMFLDFYDLYLNVSCVVADNYNGGYLLTKYLVDQGHKDIVYVGDIFQTTSIMDRAMGYYRCLLDYNVDIRKKWHISDRDDEGFIVDPILPSDMPSAFVCNSDITAKRLYEILLKKGYKVPDDISIVGYDNFPQMADVIGITTMEVRRDLLAQLAVKTVLNILNDDNHFELVNLSCQLVVKESVKNLK